jgi:hypothetical protein
MSLTGMRLIGGRLPSDVRAVERDIVIEPTDEEFDLIWAQLAEVPPGTPVAQPPEAPRRRR